MSAADIATVNSSFEDAVRRGDVEAIANLYGPDAVVLAPDGPIVKRLFLNAVGMGVG